MAVLRAAPLPWRLRRRGAALLFYKTEVFHMRVLVLGGSTASVQAGHQVTLCTPYYALGEDAAGN